ncbi:hypothetical protein, partial [Bacillus mobilis]|uniref:hypothetical protein n=1 Tax=Bacillus mobilis TaxID=2026190 RepID=UPI0036439D10
MATYKRRLSSSSAAWVALPKRIPSRWQRLAGWLTGLLGTAGAFVADRGWESTDDPSWYGPFRLIDMFGGASILLATAFCLAGWMLGRGAIVAAPIVLTFAAVPHTLDGYTSAPVWWCAAAVGAVLAAGVASRSWRELRAVRSLAQASATGRTATVGPTAVQASRRVLRRGLISMLVPFATAGAGWAAAFAVLPAELGLTYEQAGQESGSTMFTAAAAALSIVAVTAATRQGWRLFAIARVGRRRVWKVPAGAGLAPSWPFGEDASGRLPAKEAKSAGCICLSEFQRSFPDADDHVLEEEGVYAAAYCPAHGIDRINDMMPEEFTAKATSTWLWDEQSSMPEPSRPEEKRLLLYGYAGHAFTGIPVTERGGFLDASFPEIGLAREAEPGDIVPGWDEAERPA